MDAYAQLASCTHTHTHTHSGLSFRVSGNDFCCCGRRVRNMSVRSSDRFVALARDNCTLLDRSHSPHFLFFSSSTEKIARTICVRTNSLMHTHVCFLSKVDRRNLATLAISTHSLVGRSFYDIDVEMSRNTIIDSSSCSTYTGRHK